MKENSIKCINGFTLKLFAILCMLIDHIGVLFFHNILLFRIIGRMAFPIFCFLIVEGFHHTKSHINYLIRLLLFALISEIPFNLTFFGSLFYPGKQNVFFTLAMGLLCLFCLEEMNTRRIFVVPLVLIWLLAYAIHADYGIAGVLVICVFYLTREMPVVQILLTGLIFYYEFSALQLYALFAFIPILLYNRKRGPDFKMLFYWFYPVHLLVLYGLTLIL